MSSILPPGEALSARPLSLTTSTANVSSSDGQQSQQVIPTVVRRQRVPFDWTVGDNVSKQDKSLEERVCEMRLQYKAMSADKEANALAMMPEGADASLVCQIS